MSQNLRNRIGLLGALIILIATSAVWADDVSGAEKLLCASIEATRCSRDGCVTDDPVVWNIPQFIEIDLADKAQQIENFKKAFSVCLEAKSYMVEF